MRIDFNCLFKEFVNFVKVFIEINYGKEYVGFYKINNKDFS